MARKPISKKTRFEIFKRDKFTCQYCGKMSPDVVLEIDHIKPVCDGGTNDELNLITSCFECNRGKGKRILDENSSLKKQQEQIKLLAEKREQLSLLIDWKESLIDIDNQVIDKIINNLSKRYDISKCEDELLDCLNYCVKKYGSRIVIDVCYEYNEEHLKLNELKSRCFYKKSDSENPTSKDVNYIVKILYNRNKIYFDEKKMIYLQINSIAIQFYGTYKYKEFVVQLTNKASNCEDWIEFKEYLSSLNI